MSTQISKFRNIIRKLVTEQLNTDRTYVRELADMDKAVKTINKDCRAMINNSFSRIVLDDGKGGKTFDIQIYPVMDITKEGTNRYDMRAYLHDSDRVYRKNVSCDDICEFIKGDLKKCVDEGEDNSYVRKALKKGKRPSWEDKDYEYKPVTLAEMKAPKTREDRDLERYKELKKQIPNEKDAKKKASMESELKLKEKRLKRSGLLEVKKKKEDDCACETTWGDMEEVKEKDIKKQKEWNGKDLDDVDVEKLLPGLNMQELVDKIENAVWGAVKREVESTHKKTAKADHKKDNLDTKKNGHTVTKQKRHSKKTDKMKDAPKENETSKSLKKSGKGGESKIGTSKVKDFKDDKRKAKQDGGKDEDMKPAKGSKKLNESVSRSKSSLSNLIKKY